MKNETPRCVVDPTWPHRPPEIQWGPVPGVALDAQDHVYIFTRHAPHVQVYDVGGKFLGAWRDSPFKQPHHLKVGPDGSIWTADFGSHVVQKFAPEGKLLLTLGTPGSPGCDASHFNKPTDMAIVPGGDAFVSDGYGNTRVAHFDEKGHFVKDWGRRGDGPGEFVLPHAIAADSRGRLYVADRNSARIVVFDRSGRLLDVWSNLIMPWGLCVTAQDAIWVCGSSPARDPQGRWLVAPPHDQIVLKLNTEGTVLGRWNLPKGKDQAEKPGELNWAHCIAVDSRGNLFLGDVRANRVQKFVMSKP